MLVFRRLSYYTDILAGQAGVSVTSRKSLKEMHVTIEIPLSFTDNKRSGSRI